jgi:hypothetical protein
MISPKSRLRLICILGLTLFWMEGAMAQAPMTPPEDACTRHRASFPALIGKPAEEVRAALWAMPGIAMVRVAGPDTALTQDFRPDRATIFVENDRVKEITCG